jgi:hypothetical protein
MIDMLVKNIKWIMLVAGVATCTTLAAVIAPQEALVNMFGSSLTEPLANLVVRSWGLLVFLTGALLIYGAFDQDFQMLCIFTAGLSKIGFLQLILMFGTKYIDTLWVTIAFDSIVVVVLGIYLFSVRATV